MLKKNLILILSLLTLFVAAEVFASGLLSSGQGSVLKGRQYARYKVQEGDSLSRILVRLKLVHPEQSLAESLKKILRLNPDMLKNKNLIKPKQVILLPIQLQDKRHLFDEEGFVLFPEKQLFQSARERKIASIDPFSAQNLENSRALLKRQPALKDSQKLSQVKFEYSCGLAKDKEIYHRLSEFLKGNKEHIENLNILFNCHDQKPEEPVKLKPWMMSFDQKAQRLGRHGGSSFFFPSIGYGALSYKEGLNVDHNFTNLFVDLRFRRLIRPPLWHLDFQFKYGVLDLDNDIENSKAQVLDLDFRLGRAFPIFSEPWRFTLFAGAFYSQMFVKEDLYGYKGVYYPQLYPEVRRIFRSGNSLSAYLKFMPTGRDFLSFDGDNSSLSFGLQYNFEVLRRDLFIQTSYSDLKFTSPDNDRPIQLNQYYIGLGAGF